MLSCRKTILTLALTAMALTFSLTAQALPWGGGGGGSSWSGTTGSSTVCEFLGSTVTLDVSDGSGVALTDGNFGAHAVVTATFNDSNPDTIVRSAGSWLDDGFKPGMIIAVKGAPFNNSIKADGNEFYTIAENGVTATTLTLIATDQLEIEGQGGGVAGVTVYPLVNFALTGSAPCQQFDDSVPPNAISDEAEVTFNISYNGVNRDCTTGDFTGCLSSADVRDNPPHMINGSLVVPASSPSAPFPGCVDGQKCTLCVRNPDQLNGKQLADFYGEDAGDPAKPYDDLTLGQSFLFTEVIVGGAIDPDQLNFRARYANSGWIAGDDFVCDNNVSVVLKTKGNTRDVNEYWTGILLLDGNLQAESLNVASTTGQIKFDVYPPSEGLTCADINKDSIRLEGVEPISGSEREDLGNGWCRSQFLWADVQAAMGAKAPFVEGTFRSVVWTAEANEGAVPAGTKLQASDSAKIVFQANETVQFATTSTCASESGTGQDTQYGVLVKVVGTPISQVFVDVADTRNGTARKNDYSFATQSLVFDANTTEATVWITVKDNNQTEPQETVELRLLNLVGPAELGSITTHTVNIVDPGKACQ